MYTNNSQTSQIIPVIKTGSPDDTTSSEMKSSSGYNSTENTNEATINAYGNSSDTSEKKNVARARAGGRSSGTHSDRRYHTTGVIEDIKVIYGKSYSALTHILYVKPIVYYMPTCSSL